VAKPLTLDLEVRTVTTIKAGPINPETGEKTPIFIEHLEVPDVYTIAMHLDKAIGDKVLELWHLAHDMRDFIQEEGRVREYPRLERDNFAEVHWSVEDLRPRRPAWSDEACIAWWRRNEGHVQDLMMEGGWESIDTLLSMADLCRGCGLKDEEEYHLCGDCAADDDLRECEDCDGIFRTNPANPDATHCGAGYLWDAEDICEQD
jgi:hypothetical protein